jgi:hypothetical protein
VEDPLRELRVDPSVRLLTQDVINEMRTVLMKVSSRQFRTKVEQALEEALSSSGLGEEFEGREVALEQQAMLAEMQEEADQAESLKLLGSLIDPVPNEHVVRTRDVTEFMEVDTLLAKGGGIDNSLEA